MAGTVGLFVGAFMMCLLFAAIGLIIAKVFNRKDHTAGYIPAMVLALLAAYLGHNGGTPASIAYPAAGLVVAVLAFQQQRAARKAKAR